MGQYSDFGFFRDTIQRQLGAEQFPVLITHSDCDGEWTVKELPGLMRELETNSGKFRMLPAEEPADDFEHTAEYREGAKSLYDCFHDVQGTNLFESLISLCQEGSEAQRPILFQ